MVPGHSSLFGWQMTTVSLCPHITEMEKSLVSLPLLVRTPVLSDQSPALMSSFSR